MSRLHLQNLDKEYRLITGIDRQDYIVEIIDMQQEAQNRDIAEGEESNLLPGIVRCDECNEKCSIHGCSFYREKEVAQYRSARHITLCQECDSPSGKWPRYVTLFKVSRCHGGREEGGWYYDAGEVIHTFPAYDEEQLGTMWKIASRWMAENVQDHPRWSVLGSSDPEVVVDYSPGKNYPEERPRYE